MNSILGHFYEEGHEDRQGSRHCENNHWNGSVKFSYHGGYDRKHSANKVTDTEGGCVDGDREEPRSSDEAAALAHSASEFCKKHEESNKDRALRWILVGVVRVQAEEGVLEY